MTDIPLPRARLRTLGPAVAIALAGIPVLALASAGSSSSSPRTDSPTIVLVHGAWADGSTWSRVTERLQGAGYDVRVPPNNLRGVGSDAADLASYLATLPGPIVLVGHSYGGIVITNAANGNSNVRSLVYVNAFIPAEGDTVLGLTHPPSIFAQDPANVFDFVPYPGAPTGAVDSYVKPSVYGDAFANEGFNGRKIGVLAASQRPLSTQVFTQPSGLPAWGRIPSWAVVGEDDRIIPVADQIAMAERAGAEVVKVDAPHLSMITDAQEVTNVIIRAARAG
ncbi:MAG: alpha/beta hydrolase [Actinomycetota bacterium]|nr:alpha/beta hydrolase [Actinomycetota bacterium]